VGLCVEIDEKALESFIQAVAGSDWHLGKITMVWRMHWEGVRLRAEKN